MHYFDWSNFTNLVFKYLDLAVIQIIFLNLVQLGEKLGYIMVCGKPNWKHSDTQELLQNWAFGI